MSETKKDGLLFYHAYEDFYKMTAESEAFRSFCRDAFGADFSQDGFSDLAQIRRILPLIPRREGAHNISECEGAHIIQQREGVHILDIGCGNGKMLRYLQEQNGAYIHGFDYSGQAIADARRRFSRMADFREGIIGEIEYPDGMFDVIISMDTMYFAKDMTAFVGQMKRWRKPGGVIFVGYQEGDVMPRTEDAGTTGLARALEANGLKYEVTDITRETYELLRTKRAAAVRQEEEFRREGYLGWFDLLMQQTECSEAPYELFAKKMARYIYVI